MIVHPVWLTLVPIFFIEMLALKYLPILGVAVPLTLLVMVLNVNIISIPRIWIAAAVFGYISDVLAGVDRGAHFFAWLACAGVLSLIQLYDKRENLTYFRTAIYVLAMLLTYQLVIYLFALETSFKYWISYLVILLGVSLVSTVVILATEKTIEKLRS
ncbi:hypothetical protein DYH10_03910 [Candidatus Saccharibacteria bacterium CPR2]|nr:hypothetical protein [Candidatus Saccharibacteria bacterium CPR2]